MKVSVLAEKYPHVNLLKRALLRDGHILTNAAEADAIIVSEFADAGDLRSTNPATIYTMSPCIPNNIAQSAKVILIPNKTLKSLSVSAILTCLQKAKSPTFLRGALGDVLMLLPVLYGLRRNVILFTESQLIPLFDGCNVIEARNIDDWQRWSGPLFNLEGQVDFLQFGEQKHRTDLFADLIGGMLGEKVTPTFDFLFAREISPASFEVGILLSPVTKSRARNWGQEIDLIRANPARVFTVVHKHHLSEYDGLKNARNLSGKTNIKDLIGICKRAEAGIVPDSGVMHVLGLLRKPTVAIFGNVIHPEHRVKYYHKTLALKTGIIEYGGCPADCCYDTARTSCFGKAYERWCMERISHKRVMGCLDEILN